MHTNTANHYLETQVKTASGEKLRLMLIEGGLRFARQTLAHWRRQNDELAHESLTRCRAIIAELLAGVNPKESELTQQVASLYLFLFQTLTEALHHRDAQRIHHVIEVLEIEHETWRQVCEQPKESPPPATSKTSANTPHIGTGAQIASRPSQGLNLQG